MAQDPAGIKGQGRSPGAARTHGPAYGELQADRDDLRTDRRERAGKDPPHILSRVLLGGFATRCTKRR